MSFVVNQNVSNTCSETNALWIFDQDTVKHTIKTTIVWVYTYINPSFKKKLNTYIHWHSSDVQSSLSNHLSDLSVSKYSSICICIIYVSYCTISIYTPSNILEVSSPVVLLALPVRPESLAVVLQWSRPAAGHPGRCSPLGACAWCPRWVWHGAGFIPVPMHVYIQIDIWWYID